MEGQSSRLVEATVEAQVLSPIIHEVEDTSAKCEVEGVQGLLSFSILDGDKKV